MQKDVFLVPGLLFVCNLCVCVYTQTCFKPAAFSLIFIFPLVQTNIKMVLRSSLYLNSEDKCAPKWFFIQYFIHAKC